jgi:hypothetical protein
MKDAFRYAAFMVQMRGLPGRNCQCIINMQFLTDLMKVTID